jgi:hypothetical protein
MFSKLSHLQSQTTVEEQHDTPTRLGRKADFENGESLKPILKHEPKTFRPQKNRWGTQRQEGIATTPGRPLGGVCVSCPLQAFLFGRFSDLQAS